MATPRDSGLPPASMPDSSRTAWIDMARGMAEISVVTFPMLPEARVVSVKDAQAQLARTIRRATALVRSAMR